MRFTTLIYYIMHPMSLRTDRSVCYKCVDHHKMTANPLCRIAAQMGHLQCLMTARRNNHGWHGTTMYAASANELSCLIYAHEHRAPWDSRTIAFATQRGSLSCLKYAVEKGCEVDARAVFWGAMAYTKSMGTHKDYREYVMYRDYH